MGKKESRRIEYQESGGGWGNPLMGRVFESSKDVPEEEWTDFINLVEQCDLSKAGELQNKPSPTDTSSFELCLKEDDKTIRLVGNMLQADDKLRMLISFIRKHSRKELLE